MAATTQLVWDILCIGLRRRGLNEARPRPWVRTNAWQHDVQPLGYMGCQTFDPVATVQWSRFVPFSVLNAQDGKTNHLAFWLESCWYE
jgi:hypothetical protein